MTEEPWALPPGWGKAALRDACLAPLPRSVRSYSHDGRRLEWLPDRDRSYRYACDVEVFDPNHSNAREGFGFTGSALARRWVVLECLAKVLGIPALILVRKGLLREMPTNLALNRAVPFLGGELTVVDRAERDVMIFAAFFQLPSKRAHFRRFASGHASSSERAGWRQFA